MTFTVTTFAGSADIAFDPAEVKIYLDRKLLGSVLIDEINDRTIQAGRSVLKI